LLIGLLTGNTVFFRLCTIAIFLLCIALGRTESKLFNPYYLFSLTPLSLSIYVSISDIYMGELKSDTWIIAIINFLSFLFALKFTPSIKSTSNMVGPYTMSSTKIHAIILLVISLFSSLYEYVTKSDFVLSSVLSLCYVPALVCALKTKSKILIILCFAVVTLSMLGDISKTSILTYCLLLFAVSEKYYNTIKKKKLIIVVVGSLFIMLFSFNLALKGRESSSSDDQIDYYLRNSDIRWSGYNALFMPYMYFTTPWTNLQYVMDNQKEYTYGIWLLKPILGYISVDDSFRSEMKITAQSSFNTFTYIGVAYKDFGLYLSIITSLCLGFFVSKIYSLYKKSKSPLDVGAYVFVAQATLQMFFSNHFLMHSYPITIVILMWMYKKMFFSNVSPLVDNSNE